VLEFLGELYDNPLYFIPAWGILALIVQVVLWVRGFIEARRERSERP